MDESMAVMQSTREAVKTVRTSYKVTRSHEIHCGHRVHGHEGKCRHLHGHAYVFELVCAADSLDRIGRVIDFGQIKAKIVTWLEEEWDHRMLIWCKDPWLSQLAAIDPSICSVPFNPTAENIAQHMVDVVGPRLLNGSGVVLVECTVHETSKCSATYSSETYSVS